MKRASNLSTRISVLIGAAAILALGSLPLMGTAQDATPAGTLNEQQLIQEGETIYTNVCIACHQPDGMGIRGIYPPLNGNPLVAGEDPTYLISTVLIGRGGMPTFSGIYSDQEIAAVTSFVRQNWDNDASAVSPDQVAALRAELRGTPEVSPTPEGQRPGGQTSGSPVSGAAASPSTPEATP